MPRAPLLPARPVARYGLTFKDFVPLDAAGPLTVDALEGDEVDVALLFTTSSAVEAAGLVLLVDDRELQPAENVVPVVRTSVRDRHGDARVPPPSVVHTVRGYDAQVPLRSRSMHRCTMTSSPSAWWRPGRG